MYFLNLIVQIGTTIKIARPFKSQSTARKIPIVESCHFKKLTYFVYETITGEKPTELTKTVEKAQPRKSSVLYYINITKISKIK